MLNKVKMYLTNINIKRHPVRLTGSVLITLVMLMISVYAWDGINKRLIICLGLSLATGVLLLLPKLPNLLTVPLTAFYLLVVPLKIFQRVELPFHDMTRIVDGVTSLTIAFIICVYLFFFLFSQRSSIALGAGNIFLLFFFLVEFYIDKFRGDLLRPSDFKAVGTAMTVIGNYNFSLTSEALYTILYFAFFISLGFKLQIYMNKRVHIGISAAAVLLIGGWYFTVMETQYPIEKEITGHYWNMSENRSLNGNYLSFFVLLRESRFDIPSGYSEETVNEIAQTAATAYVKTSETEQKPDIIMIMNESWSDLGVLGELDTSQDYMPFLNSLEENTIKGNLYVSIWGGLTANTEFEALTGNSLSLLSPTTIPYQNQVNHDMPSLARVLAAQGYKTMAMHPNSSETWNRRNVYSYLGFDESVFLDDWQVPYEYVKDFISDECNFNEIIWRYENRNQDAPFFLFDVTIQNHGSYYGQVPLDIEVNKIGNVSADEAGYTYDLQTYINLVKVTDEAFEKLIEYFKNVDRPVIICMFGDHQPILSDNFYEAIFSESELTEREQNIKKYITPYVIWANYDVDWEDYGDMSANYLSTVLMESSNLKMPAFYQYLSEMRKKYPILTIQGCLEQNGNMVDISDIWDTESILEYRILQYNQLYEKKYLNEIFVMTQDDMM
jgi:phosphoglycerol transferase MdoB-like AlkP superfamily enzyme